MNDYESLKKLLLQDEIEAIVKLDERLHELLKQTQDHDLIIQRLTPIIGDLLKETISNSSDEIAKVMAPIMGDAIKEQVKTQKQTIVDALYPVMGNMIAKFVSSALKDTLDEINAKVQNNLSFSALKRKITARIKGVDESELLLRESSLGIIETLFLIHTDSGLLIWQGSRDKEDVIEAEMVSSMLSAIRSFVNDWIAQSSDVFELNTIDYGDSKILLEVSGSCYLAVVIRGEARAKMQEKITTIFSELMQEHSDSLNDFDGDTSRLDLESISENLQKLFDIKESIPAQTDKKESSNWFIYAFLGIMFGLFTYLFYSSYVKEKKETLIIDKFYHTPELNLYRIDADIVDDKIILSGVVPNRRLKNLAESLVKDESLGLDVENKIVLSVLVPSVETILSHSKLLDKIYNRQKDVNISSQLKDFTLILSGKVPNISKKDEIIDSYSEIDGVKNVISAIEFSLSPITEKISFKTGEWKLNQSQKDTLKKIIKKYDLLELSNKKSALRLNISAYTDGIGDIESNKKYAEKRVKSVKDYLIKSMIKEEFIVTNSYPYPPKDYKVSQDLGEARVAEFTWMYK